MNSMKQRISRILLGVAVLGIAGFFSTTQTGCGRGVGSAELGSTPVYSTKERFARINRNWNLEWEMMNDDIDHLLLLRPVSSLSMWHVP